MSSDRRRPGLTRQGRLTRGTGVRSMSTVASPPLPDNPTDLARLFQDPALAEAVRDRVCAALLQVVRRIIRGQLRRRGWFIPDEAVHDIATEIVLVRLAGFDGRFSFPAWCRTVAHHSVRGWMRRGR